MNLPDNLKKRYSKDNLKVQDAQRLAHEISFGPIVFQVSRIMLKFGILDYLRENKEGKTIAEIADACKLTIYATKVLLESSLTAGTVLVDDNSAYTLSKTGWFMLTDPMVKVNMDFNHFVNYKGLFDLEAALLSGKPEGLKNFGNWDTVYEGLSSLPEDVQDSWFGFDHFYSDCSFDDILKIVLHSGIKTVLDVGGNTGRWALKCVNYSDTVLVTVMDLPQQIELMLKNVKGKSGEDRILGYEANLLDKDLVFPQGYDVIWMSQFLDCFSEKEIISILSCAKKSMTNNTELYIMEPFWNRQKYETAAYDLTQTSLYFTAIANGNSKMYTYEDMESCINKAGLVVKEVFDNFGMGSSIVKCKLN